VSGFLLDTHVLIWAVSEPSRLSTHARELIEDPSNPLVVSAASAWEIAIKHRLGKLPGSARLLSDYRGALGRLGARSLVVTDEHALAAGSLSHPHKDPFDRMLVAQAVIEDLEILTSDRVLAELPGARARW
jgi:PIN domain nuclease of toxin-antitoxin system